MSVSYWQVSISPSNLCTYMDNTLTPIPTSQCSRWCRYKWIKVIQRRSVWNSNPLGANLSTIPRDMHLHTTRSNQPQLHFQYVHAQRHHSIRRPTIAWRGLGRLGILCSTWSLASEKSCLYMWLNESVSMLLTTVLLMYIYTACWLNNYVVQLCPFWSAWLH